MKQTKKLSSNTKKDEKRKEPVTGISKERFRKISSLRTPKEKTYLNAQVKEHCTELWFG